jgi:hypothetical protein
VLLDPQKKVAYDAALRQQLGVAPKVPMRAAHETPLPTARPLPLQQPRPAQPQPTVPNFAVAAAGMAPVTPRKKQPQSKVLAIYGLLAAVPVVVGVIVFLLTRPSNQVANVDPASPTAAGQTSDDHQPPQALTPPEQAVPKATTPVPTQPVSPTNESQIASPANVDTPPVNVAPPEVTPATHVAEVPRLDPIPLPPTDIVQPPQQPLAAKLPAPDAAALSKAQSELSALFKDELAAATTPAAQTALAQKLTGLAAQSASDPTSCYALLRSSVDLAAKAGDVTTAYQAIDRLTLVFDVDAVETEFNALTQLAKAVRRPADEHPFVARSAEWVNRAIRDGRFDLVPRLSAAAETLLRRTGRLAVMKQFTALANEAKLLEREHQTIAPALASPDLTSKDPTASSAAGKYCCFVLGDWEQGLPLLAAGDDAALSALAASDLAAPQEGAAQAKLGDDWLAQASGQSGRKKTLIQQRAAHWYQQSLGKTSALLKAAVEKKLRDVQGQLSQDALSLDNEWFVIFRSADPTLWNTETSRGTNFFAIPLDSVPDNVRFLRLAMSAKLFVIVSVPKAELKAAAKSGTCRWQGENFFEFKGYHLGIFNTQWKSKVGDIAIRGCKGWGFGNKSGVDDRQCYGWEGQVIPPTVFEISVKVGDLDATEQSQLLE